MEAISSLGAWIRRRRKALALTQPALADCVACAVITIQKIEADERRPSAQMAARLVECLAIGADERQAFLASCKGERAPDRLPAPTRTVPLPLPIVRAPAHNLPAATHTLFGRHGEIDNLVARLHQPAVRLLTLTGPGGVGKTSLALATARQILDVGFGTSHAESADTLQNPNFPDGIWLIELAGVAAAEHVASAVLLPFALPEQSGQPAIERLCTYLRDKRLLLLLDNCEHLLAECAVLAERLLQSSPGLTLLATSREPLNIAGEIEWRVPPLATPTFPVGRKSSPHKEEIGDFSAVQLFAARGQAVHASFAITDHNALAVTQICERLDGLPLALELAAARLKTLSINEIHAQLTGDSDNRFALLTGGRRTVLARQQTLRATLDWSYQLLNASERMLWQQLAVFANGFTLEAVVALCQAQPHVAAQIPDPFAVLVSLVDKSLVVRRGDEEESRYLLLETIRQYGWEQLVAAAHEQAAQTAHLAWYRHWAQQADPQLRRADQARWFARFEREQDNLRVALTFATLAPPTQPERQLGLDLLMALWHFWEMRGLWQEQKQWFHKLIAGVEKLPLTLAGVQAAAWQANFCRDAQQRQQLFAASQQMAAALADQAGLAFSLCREADWAWWVDGARAHELFQQGLAIARQVGDQWQVALILRKLGELAYVRLEARTQARAHFGESLHLFRQLGDQYGVADVLVHLADVALEQGDSEAALRDSQEGLAISRALGFRYGILWGLMVAGSAAGGKGDFAPALEWLEECLAVARELGTTDFIGVSLFWLANTLRWQGDLARAHSLLQEALANGRRHNELNTLGMAHYGLAEIARTQRNFVEAQQHLTEALRVWQKLDYLWGIARAFAAQAHLAAAQDEPAEAVRLLAASAACQQKAAIGFTPLEQAEVDQALAELRRRLSPAAFQTAWQAGWTAGAG